MDKFICESNALQEGGDGVRFTVNWQGSEEPAFVVRFENTAHAYLNRCAHVPMEMDWQQGKFFDDQGLYLLCSTHGAAYLPDTGECAGGPCNGGLVKLPVLEREQKIFLQET